MPHVIVSKTGSFFKEFVFPDLDIITVGRSSTNDIVLPHPERKVSRLHAAIIRCSGREHSYFIRDLGSIYGTKVDGATVERRCLRDGDEIEIADYTMRYDAGNESRIRNCSLRVVSSRLQSIADRNTTIGSGLLISKGSELPERRELLEELWRKAEDTNITLDVAAKALRDLLLVLKADRGFVRIFSDMSFSSYEDVGITGLRFHEQIEITDAAFMERLKVGEVVLDEGTMIAPILSQKKLRGFICVDRINRTIPFSSIDAEFLNAVSSQISPKVLMQTKDRSSLTAHDWCDWPMHIVGKNKLMGQLFRDIRHAATSDMNVLLVGETGTGKDLVAREIHLQSRHNSGPWVVRHCGQTTESLAETDIFGYAPKSGIAGARPEGAYGWFQLANGGTLFLDEIQALSPTMQDKFLRVLQEKHVRPYGAAASVHVDVKVVAASSEVDLESAIQEGTFRKPFYFRFGIKLRIPPLRERKDDIPLLAYLFLDRAFKMSGGGPRSFSHRALRKLADYDWPGNVRELEHLINSAVHKDKEILFSWDFDLSGPAETASHTAVSTPVGAPAEVEKKPLKTMREVEKTTILETLEATHGNISQAAHFLGFSRQTLLNKMDTYGIPRNYGDSECVSNPKGALT